MSWFEDDLGFIDENQNLPNAEKTKYDSFIESEFVEVKIINGIIVLSDEENEQTTNTANVSS